jgi:hypothetical protein
VGFLFTLGSFQTSGPRAFRQANLALGLMMAWFLLLLLIDGADRGRVVPQAVGVGLISWAFLALGRLVYLVDQLVRLGVKDLSNQPTAGLAPPFSEPLDDDSGPT